MKTLFKKISITSYINISRKIIVGAIGLSAVTFLMLYRLVSLTPGLSAREIEVHNSSSSISIISDNLINAPYKIAVLLSTKLFEPEFGLRLVGALMGIISIVLFYALVSHLYGKYVSLATTAMFASSSLLLGMSRSASPIIMLLSLITIVAAGAYVRFGKNPELSWPLLAFIIGLSLYTPGIILFTIPAALWQFKYIKSQLETVKNHTLISSGVIIGLMLIPLLANLIGSPELIRNYLGLGPEIQPVSEMLKYASVAIVSIFAFAPIDSAYWLGRQPILDVFGTTMFILGSYNLVKRYKLNRLWLVLGVVFLSLAWIGVTTNRYSIIILLPFIYMVIGSGLSVLLESWNDVFPKNPIAKYIGIGLVLVALVISINFQLQRYFVAWANHKPTKEVFTEHIR